MRGLDACEYELYGANAFVNNLWYDNVMKQSGVDRYHVR